MPFSSKIQLNLLPWSFFLGVNGVIVLKFDVFQPLLCRFAPYKSLRDVRLGGHVILPLGRHLAWRINRQSAKHTKEDKEML